MMDEFDEPLNLTIKKMPVSTTLVDLNRNIKTLNADLIKRNYSDVKNNEDVNVNGINAIKHLNYFSEQGCLDLSKSNIKTQDNSYVKNNEYRNIYDDVYKHSYIYENLTNTYLSTPETVFSLFTQVTHDKLLANWYANSLLNASSYLNLARTSDVHENKHNHTSSDDSVLLNNKTTNKQNKSSRSNFELIKNRVQEEKIITKNDFYSNLNKNRAYRGNP